MISCLPPAGLRTAALAFGLLLAGCSALQIDVDVYKGPLTSQREVQLRQLSTLAMAAKPLLAELRNAAEKTRTGFELTRGDQRQSLWSYYDYEYSDPLARFANGALSFYEDTAPALAPGETSEVDIQHQAFRKALVTFEVSAADCRLAGRIRSSDQVPRAIASFLRAGAVEGSAEPRSTACGGGQRDPAFATASAAAGKRLIEKVRNAKCGAARDSGCVVPTSVTAAYAALAVPGGGLVRELAADASAGDGALARDLEKRLQEIGAAFVEARERMRKLWDLSVTLLDESYRRLPGSRAVVSAEFIANTTEPRVLACYLSAFPGRQDVDPRVRKAVQDAVARDWTGDTLERSFNFKAAVEALAGVAHLYPYETADSLRHVDAALLGLNDADAQSLRNCPYFRGFTPSQTERDRQAELTHASKRYGLARGTAVENRFDDVLETIVQSLDTLSATSAYGFHEGRQREGLVRLTKAYIDLLHEPQSGSVPARLKESRRRLEEALIAFAERVLYLSNNAPLLNDRIASDVELARNAALLQALGNTIIVLVDDVRRQDEHDRRSTERASVERQALRQAFDPPPEATYDALLAEVGSMARSLGADAAALKAKVAPAGAAASAASDRITLLGPEIEGLQKRRDDQARSTEEALSRAQATRSAAVTVTEPRPVKGMPAMPDDDRAAADRKAIAAVAAALPASAPGADVVAAVKQWVGDQIAIDKPGGATPRLQRLEAAKAYLDQPEIQFPSLPPADARTAFAEIGRRLAAWLQNLEQEAVRQLALRTVAQARLDDAVAAREAARKDLQRAQDQQRTADDRARQAAERGQERELALQALRQVRPAVLAKAGSGDEAADAVVLKRLVLAELKAQADGAKDDNARKPFTAAQEYVSRTTPSRGWRAGTRAGAGAGSDSRQRQVDVLDELIAELRHRHLKALAEASPLAPQIEAALKAAIEQRGSMAYLRPTSAYLRNVYAATAIQADPDLDYSNLLTSNLFQIFTRQDAGTKARISVEKQFWQNINSVRVGGAGASDYVLVKDDVGNWYLKALSSDTASIVQSAQSLALFNLGRKFDANLLRRTELQRRSIATELSAAERDQAKADLRDLDSSNPQAGTGASTAGLATLRGKYEQDYARRTAADVSATQAAVARLGTELTAAWKNAISGDVAEQQRPLLEQAVAAESDEQRQARERLEAVDKLAEGERAAGGADAMVDALRTMRRLRDRLALQIRGNDALVQPQRKTLEDKQKALDALGESHPDRPAAQTAVNAARQQLQTAEANRETAAKTATKVVNAMIGGTVARRLEAIKTAETAYGFIGEAATAR